MQEASWQLWLTGQSTEGTDMNIQRSRKEQWLGTERPSGTYGELKPRWLGHQTLGNPTKPGRRQPQTHTLAARKELWPNSATVHQSWLPVNTFQRQSCQPIRPVKAPGAEQAPMDHHSQVNWSNDHNQYTLSGSIIYQQLSREGAHIPNVKVLIPRTSVADEQQRKNCHQRWRKALLRGWPCWLYLSLHFT